MNIANDKDNNNVFANNEIYNNIRSKKDYYCIYCKVKLNLVSINSEYKKPYFRLKSLKTPHYNYCLYKQYPNFENYKNIRVLNNESIYNNLLNKNENLNKSNTNKWTGHSKDNTILIKSVKAKYIYLLNKQKANNDKSLKLITNNNVNLAVNNYQGIRFIQSKTYNFCSIDKTISFYIPSKNNFILYCRLFFACDELFKYFCKTYSDIEPKYWSNGKPRFSGKPIIVFGNWKYYKPNKCNCKIYHKSQIIYDL